MQFIQKNTFLQFALALGLIGLVFVFHSPKVAAAACTAPATDYGSVTGLTISIPAGTPTASYRVWTRMGVADSTNVTYLLEVDGNCVSPAIGNSTIPVSSDLATTSTTPTVNWAWVDYYGATSTNKVNVSLAAGSHTVKLIGNAPNVAVDRVIFTQDTGTTGGCNVNMGTGNSCASPADTTPPVTAITAPTAGATVSGTTIISATASDDSGTVAKVEFYVDGTLKASDTSTPYTYGWDTTTATPGSHSLTTKAYDGATPANITTSSAVSVTVSNTGTPKPGDANGDNTINILDLSVLASNYGQSGRTRAQGDFDGNGLVNILDLSILASNWGK